jgi:hypothetical protein
MKIDMANGFYGSTQFLGVIYGLVDTLLGLPYSSDHVTIPLPNTDM